MKKRILLTIMAVAAIAFGVVGMSAYEAHVINVTAKIENATNISTAALTYGTVFPQEVLHQPITLSLSTSFANSGATGVDYKIKQKPKCKVIDPAAGIPPYAQVTENTDGNFICPNGYTAMPLLCPFLSKTSPKASDTSVSSFHGPLDLQLWNNAMSESLKATGHLTQTSPATTWDIDLHTPCFAGQCGQDWATYVLAANPTAIPANYLVDPTLKGQELGCDLWYEVTGVNRPVTVNKVTANDLFSGSNADAYSSGKWFMYNDSTDAIDNTPAFGSFVAGPSTPIYGTGSVQFTLAVAPDDRKNIATYQFSGTTLASITQMSFGAYSHSGSGSTESAFLNFNVDFNGSDTWQKRLVYVPTANGQDTWNNNDAINGGTALWSWSGFVANGNQWPDGNTNEYRSWSSIITAFPSARIRVTDSWLGVRVGQPGPTGYTANVDFFSIATGGTPTVYDFEN